MQKPSRIFTILFLITGVLLANCQRTPDGHDHDHNTTAQHDHKADEPHQEHGTDTHAHEHHVDEHENEHPEQDAAAQEEHSEDLHPAADIMILTAEEARLIGIKTIVVGYQDLSVTIPVPGKIITNPNMAAAVSPFIDASINRVFKNLGDRVQKGDILACLTSPEIGLQRAEFGKAKAELEIATENQQRQQRLLNEKIISNKAFQAAELAYKIARTNYEYSVKKMMATGIPKAELEQPPEGHSDAVGSTLHMTAPISGVITYRDVILGDKIAAGEKIFEIVNLAKVWLQLDVFEKQLTLLEKNQTVRIRTAAYPDELFTGKIFYIANTLDPVSKSIKILAEILNPNEKLKPGMFADAEIITNISHAALSLPKAAVLEDENLKIVFVKESHGFQRHIVETGIETDELVEITAGLTPGMAVVVAGNYQLKSKSKMSGIDPHAGHNH